MAFGWFSKKSTGGGDKVLQKARKLSEQGRWAEALTYYEEALEAGPAAEEAGLGIRTCRERLVDCNLEEASAFSRSNEPEQAAEHARLALTLAGDETDLAERARAALEALAPKAATHEPEEKDSPERLFPPTCSCAAPCGAEEAPEATPEEDGEPEALFEFYLESLSEQEREALEPLDESFQRGFVQLQQGATEAARPNLEAAAKTSPEAHGTHYALGLLASLEEDRDAAAACFARCLELAPDFAPAAHHWADLLREGERLEEATGVLDRWLEGHGEDGDAWLLVAACRQQGGDAAGGLEAAETAERLIPAEDPRPLLLKAQALRRLDRADEALAALQGAVARRPDFLEALIPLGQLLLEKGGTSAERAAEVFKQCCKRDPERAWWYLLRVADAYLVRGWRAEAKEVLEAARRGLPDEPEARVEWEATAQRASA